MGFELSPTWDDLIADMAFSLLFVVGFVFLLWTLIRRRADGLETLLWIGGGAMLLASAATCLENILKICSYASGSWRTTTWDVMARNLADVRSHWFLFALFGATVGLLIVAYRHDAGRGRRTER